MNNLKNLFHGTKAFLDQIVKNFIQNKSFSCFIRDYSFKNINLQDFVRKTLNKGFNYENDELIGRTKTRELDIIEKQFFTNKNYKIVSTEVTCSERAFLNFKTYHSKNYKFRRDSNSFTVRFVENQEEKFGEILEFFNLNGEVFVKINEFIVTSDLRDVFPVSTGYFYSVLTNNVLNRFYKLIVSTSNTIRVIFGRDITCKCIVFNNNNKLTITPVIYEYEHD